MMLQVNGYALSWNVPGNNGVVFLHFTTNQQVQIPVDSASELSALGDLLRSSANVFFDPNTQTLSTPVKPPGVA